MYWWRNSFKSFPNTTNTIMPKIFKGCDLASSLELNSNEFYPQVPATKTYYPLPHIDFYLYAKRVLTEIGIGIVAESFGLTPQKDRMFMWLETDTTVEDLPLCIGGRNSYDKSMSAGLCVGTKIMVCSNKVLASYENGGVVSRKHTSAENIDELGKEFTKLLFTQTSQRADTLFNELEDSKTTVLLSNHAKALLTDLVLTNIICPTDVSLIWKEYNNPTYEFNQYIGTNYGFLMAVTEVFKLHKGADYQIKAYDGVAKALGL